MANLTAPGIPGVGRVAWDFKLTQDLRAEMGSEGARLVSPGEYTVTLKYGSTKREQKLRVEIAPGIETR